MQPSEAQRNQTVASLSQFLSDHPELHTVILFGSGARGRLRRTGDYPSDLDVAVAAREELPLSDRMELTAELQRQMSLDVDLVDLHTAHGGFLMEILAGGIIIRKDPEFIAGKYLEMYDYTLFLAPQLRAARERRLERYFTV